MDFRFGVRAFELVGVGIHEMPALRLSLKSCAPESVKQVSARMAHLDINLAVLILIELLKAELNVLKRDISTELLKYLLHVSERDDTIPVAVTGTKSL